MARNRYFEDEETKKLSVGSIKRALKFALPYRKLLVLMLVLMGVITFISMLPPMINGYIVDDVLTKNGWESMGLDWKELCVVLVGAYVITVVTDTVFSFFRQFYMTKIGHSIVHDIRYATYNRLQKLCLPSRWLC